MTSPAALPVAPSSPSFDAYLDGLIGVADVSLRLSLLLVSWLPGAAMLLPAPHILMLRKRRGALRIDLSGGSGSGICEGVYVLSAGHPHARTPRGVWVLRANDCVACELPTAYEALRARVSGGQHGVLAEVEHMLPGSSKAVAGAAGALVQGASSALAWTGSGIRSLLGGAAAARTPAAGAGKAAGAVDGSGVAVITSAPVAPTIVGGASPVGAVAKGITTWATGAAAAASSFAAASPLSHAAATVVPTASAVPAPLLLPLLQLTSACPLSGPLGSALSALTKHLGSAVDVASSGVRIPVSFGLDLAVSVEDFQLLGDVESESELIEVPVGWAFMQGGSVVPQGVDP